MGKTVVYGLIAVATFIFIFHSPKLQSGRNRRLGQRVHIPNFDPLVSKLERLAQEKDSSTNNTPDDESAKNGFEDPKDDDDDDDTFEEFLGNEGNLNTKMRIRVLFPLLDLAPRDGYVSLKEFQTWMIQRSEDELSYRTEKELKLRDENGDGEVSFAEFLPKFSRQDIEKNEMGHGEAGWWMQRFVNSDFDHNGSLNLHEFRDFLHPEDSRNEEIQRWVMKERINGMDYNGDGKLDYREFLDHAYNMYRDYLKFETAGNYIPTSGILFAELDRNRDRFLDADELRPILPYLQPGEISYIKSYSIFLLREADDDKDGRLSLEEILNHEGVFYKAVQTEDLDGAGAGTGEDDYYHDEL